MLRKLGMLGMLAIQSVSHVWCGFPTFRARNADQTVGEYLSAGAALGGAGNTFLATEQEIEEKDWAAVQAKASAFVGAVDEWKAANPSPSL
jgi:2-keto-3-deoxy-6-phosphogluconate aldolase